MEKDTNNMDATIRSTAATRAFAIPELLGHILAFIVQHDRVETLTTYVEQDEEARAQGVRALFRMQRVNKTFQDVIHRSKTLRLAMFLEHTHDSTEAAMGLERFNPLIFHLCDSWVEKGYCQQYPGEGKPYKSKCDDSPENLHFDIVLGDLWEPFAPLESSENFPSATKTPSWRNALISNAPISISFHFKGIWRDYRGDCARDAQTDEREHEFLKGATLGELGDFLAEELQRSIEHMWQCNMNLVFLLDSGVRLAEINM